MRTLGRWFRRPQYKIGRRFAVSGIKGAAGNPPVELEALSLEPRLFYVHNFLSTAETAALIAKAEDQSNPYSIRPSTTGHKSWVSPVALGSVAAW
jgi:hypothetical protein